MQDHNLLSGALVVLCLFGGVQADLPVHCPHHTQVGTWVFSMSAPTQDKNLKCANADGQQMCFYGSCFTNTDIGPPAFKKDFEWTVSLADPNVAIATNEKGDTLKGTWTSVYDEGFEVDVQGRKFFAFSHFDDQGSNCDRTHPGWHRDAANPDAKKWGCYTAKKQTQALQEEHLMMLTQEEQDAHSTATSLPKPQGLPKVKAYEQPTPASQQKMYQPETELVQRINAKPGNTWKAKAYPQFQKLSMAEFNRMAGFRPAAKKLQQHQQQQSAAESATETVMLQEDEIADLPETFDWRNVNGENFVDPVIEQRCGSCFAVATTSMMMSRVRILTKNKQKPHIPYEQVLKCDRYNQGCAGGYPFLVEKYTQDFGLTTSGKCAQPKSSSSSGEQGGEAGEMEMDQEATGENDAYIRVKNFGYIGGYYGNTRTEQMMHELHANGPIVVGINGGYELMLYQEGIFVDTGEAEANGIRNDFEKVEHAVLVVGWGKENDQRYWIVKNSYGQDWGENGYFRIPLGGDQDGITSLTSSAIPVLGGSDYFNELEMAAQQTSREADAVAPHADAVPVAPRADAVVPEA
jgi:cathepsin C